MTGATVTRLDGYDRDGIHVGRAEFVNPKSPWPWKVMLTRPLGGWKHSRWGTDEADARRLLAEAGAVEVRAGDGRK